MLSDFLTLEGVPKRRRKVNLSLPNYGPQTGPGAPAAPPPPGAGPGSWSTPATGTIYASDPVWTPFDPGSTGPALVVDPNFRPRAVGPAPFLTGVEQVLRLALGDYYTSDPTIITQQTPAQTAAATTRPSMFAPATPLVNTPDLFSMFYGVRQQQGLRGCGELALSALASRGVRMPRHMSGEEVEAAGLIALATLSGIDFITEDRQESLGGFSFKRAFTPPRAIRKMIKPPKAVSKVLRYAGAAAFTFATPFGLGLVMGRQRNKMFGLTGGEMKAFDAAAKVGRIATIAVATVAGGAAIIGALSAPAAAAAAPLLTPAAVPAATGASGIMAATEAATTAPLIGAGVLPAAGAAPFSVAAGVAPSSGLFSGALSFLKSGMDTKVGSFIIKDVGQEMVMRVTSDLTGRLLGEKFNKDQIPPEVYNALPPNQPIPTATEQGGGGMAPLSAGAGSMSSDTTDPEDQGDTNPEDVGTTVPGDEEDASLVRASDRIDPTDTEGREAQLSPEQTARLTNLVNGGDDNDDTPLTDLIAKGKAASPALEKEMIEGEPSLKAQALRIQRNRALSAPPRPRKSSRKPAPDAAPTFRPGSPGYEQARLARLYRIVHE